MRCADAGSSSPATSTCSGGATSHPEKHVHNTSYCSRVQQPKVSVVQKLRRLNFSRRIGAVWQRRRLVVKVGKPNHGAVIVCRVLAVLPAMASS